MGEFLRAELAAGNRYLPAGPNVLRAFTFPFDQVRVLIVGHVATRWALDHFITGTALEDLIDADFAWQPGWEYRLG